ncbi:MFS transporter [Rugamonas sp.]|uniref:MFS transporter n=1 Tax=Rugamonas sp. TaxID=1926287 RepID=UPI0025D0841A|nr:MFS transporter [Rugamonas sp.]
MTVSTTTAPGHRPPPAPAAQPFGLRILTGLCGVLLAALWSGLNDRVSSISLPDLRGLLGIGYDEGSWYSAVYIAAEIAAMMMATWFAVTFSFRRFAITVTLAFAVLGAVLPLVHNYPCLLMLRVAQGLFGGAMPPLLMTAALRFLPPGIKLYGMAGYALTATFGPNLAMPLAALFTDTLGWQWIYWQVIPPCLIAAAMMAWGLPQDPVRLERFYQFDWAGALTGCGGIVMLVLALEQGERLHWLHSSLICTLLFGAAVLLPLFFVNEWHHPLPFFKLQMLGRRNFSHGLLALGGFLILSMAGSALPAIFLTHVQDYRPLQIGPLALSIAIPQLLACPLAAALCNIRRLDSRIVMGCGFALLCWASYAGSHLSSVWVQDNFYLLQAIHAIGQPLAVLPILMGATGAVQPVEGPFASAMFNTTRGMSAVIGGSLIETFVTHREQFHSNVLLNSGTIKHPEMLLDSETPLALSGGLGAFAGRVHEQAITMGIADAYLLLAGLAVLLFLMLLMPKRSYPPKSHLPPQPPPAPQPAQALSAR